MRRQEERVVDVRGEERGGGESGGEEGRGDVRKGL